MTIAVDRVHEVPIGRVLALAGLSRKGYWSFGTTFTCPSPRATPKQQRSNPIAFKVGRDGAWTDQHTGRTGTDVAGLFAYVSGTSRTAALAKLAAELQPGDLLLDRAIRPGDTERRGPVAGDPSPPTSPAMEDQRLRKFASHGTPRQRNLALLQVAMNYRAADLAEDRKAGRR